MALALLAASCAPETAEMKYDAEDLCTEMQTAYCAARTRCGQPVPNCTMECFRYSGETTITEADMQRCADDFMFEACSSLEDKAFLPTSCGRVNQQLQQHKE